jgi:MoaA/NifB/PqqE/SkfB family radical SAM enzyme
MGRLSVAYELKPPVLTIYYRGPLASCNFRCPYCTFVKHQETDAEMADDRRALERFCRWAAAATHHRLAILFTPCGEALVRPWYRDALIALSHLSHVERVAIQTNLSVPLDWLASGDRQRLALWCTYHPEQIRRDTFLDHCRELDAGGCRYSVGIVGLRQYWAAAAALRKELAAQVYLWINAYKDTPGYYTENEIRQWETIDPLFRLNLLHHPSRGRDCRAGGQVILVDGAGTIRRCHFIPKSLGNLYDDGFEPSREATACPNENCGCYIGYVHLGDLSLDAVFRGGILERIPFRDVVNDAVARGEALDWARNVVARAAYSSSAPPWGK